MANEVVSLAELKNMFNCNTMKIKVMQLKTAKYVNGGVRVDTNGNVIVDKDGNEVIFPDQIIREYISFKNEAGEVVAVMFCNRIVNDDGSFGVNVTDLDESVLVKVLKNSTFKITEDEYPFKDTTVMLLSLKEIGLTDDIDV